MTDYFQQLTGVTPGTPGARGPLARAVALEEVTWTSLHGPRTPDVVDRILGDQWLSGHLRRLWAEDPPTAELRQRLAADRFAVVLLTLAPDVSGTVVRGPAAWFTGRSSYPVQMPQAHAAGSDAAPLLAHVHDEVGVSVEARGRSGDFSIRVSGTAAPGDRFVAVEVQGTPDLVYVVPLRADAPVASFVCPLGDGLRIAPADDLMAALDQPEVAEVVRRSVAAADGTTQEVWRALALHAGKGTALYAAVADGLR